MKERARIEKYLHAYERAVEDYEQGHPHWRIEVLVSLIKWSLRSLQYYIEDSRERKITWADPFVELRFPVGWNWSPRNGDEIAPGGHEFGQITTKNVASKTKAHEALSKIMVEQLNAMTLAEATNWVWYEKLNNYLTPALPVEHCEKLKAIKSKRVRRETFEELVRPFAIGGAYIDYGDIDLTHGTPVPKRVTRQLANIGMLMDIPRISFSGEANGRKFEVSLVFLIHPLIADYDQKKAYHPVTVGLAFIPEMAGGEIKECDPEKWSRQDQQGFWKGLLSAVEEIGKRLIPKTEAEESVILSVNSQLKVPASRWRPENRTATMKQIADAQAQTGELVRFSVEPAEGVVKRTADARCSVCGWIHDAGFTQIRVDEHNVATLGGLLPDIVRLVHCEHEKGLAGLSTKDPALLNACAGYRHPCKAFDDLNRRAEYKLLFDTSRRGSISLRGAVGINRNKSEQIGI